MEALAGKKKKLKEKKKDDSGKKKKENAICFAGTTQERGRRKKKRKICVHMFCRNRPEAGEKKKEKFAYCFAYRGHLVL